MAVRFRVGDSLELAADVEGQWNGKPVLLLHGGGQTRHAWGYTMSALGEAGFLAISLDLRGHGYSDWAPDANYSVDAYAKDLRAVVDLIGKPVALVGASLGGLLSLIAAGEAPRVSCTALVLVDVAPRIERDGRDRIIEFMRSHPDGFTSIEEAASSVAGYLPHRPRPADISGLAKNLRLGPDGRYRWHWDPALVAEQHIDNTIDHERYERAALAIDAPMLLVRGRMSDVLSEAGAQAFRRAVPSAEYVDVREAGHMIAGDRNDVFTSAVISFLIRKLS
ncbi:MAG: alpha/beta fold hydrolase [Syntrophobacteraceae bacterium]